MLDLYPMLTGPSPLYLVVLLSASNGKIKFWKFTMPNALPLVLRPLFGMIHSLLVPLPTVPLAFYNTLVFVVLVKIWQWEKDSTNKQPLRCSPPFGQDKFMIGTAPLMFVFLASVTNTDK